MSLPSGYKRLEYIQSSGTQYIDTKVKPTVNTKFSFGVYMLEQTGDCIIGNFLHDYNDYRIFNYSGSIYWDFKDSRIIGTAGSFPKNTYFEFECGNNYVKKNGQQVLTGQNISAFTADANIFVFTNGASARCSGRLYFLKIFDGESLIRDFVPCINGSGEVGLYDLVEKQFYGNAGTGAFTAGPVIAIAASEPEITEIEYIQSSGTQYIDTGVPVKSTSGFEVSFAMTATSGQIGVIGGFTYGGYNHNFAAYDGKWITQYGNNEGYQFGSVDTERHTVSQNVQSGTVYFDGETIKTGLTYYDNTSRTFRLFCYNGGDSYPTFWIGPLKLYSCKIYDNGTLVRDYIAAKLYDGTVGLYDKLNGLLYVNAGTGAFEAGPEVGVATPENFRLSSSTETTATLAWSAVDGATGYKLYRDGILIATLTDTSYTDTIQTFTSYIYTLTAYNGNGESDPASISVQIIIPPETPSNFRASSASMTAISLAWDAVTGADSYQLKRNGSVIYSGEGTSYTDSDLTAETAYTYTLSAVNTTGSSAETMLEAATTQFILVTDRTSADVTAQNAKGTYNAADLNRVGEAMNYVADRLRSAGYDPHISPKTDWKETDWPTPQTMERYLRDVSTLRGLLTQMETTPDVPKSMEKLTHWTANDIEQILMDLNDSITRLKAAMFYAGEIYSGEG